MRIILIIEQLFKSVYNNVMEIIIKKFDDLTAKDLYDIYHVRTSIFVVEQNCPYQEVDEQDLISTHFYIKEDDNIVAYLRLFPKDDHTGQIGRVLSTQRRKGYASKLVEKAIAYAKDYYDELFLEAQTYVVPLYEQFGFKVCGEEFLEDGIPHKPMTLRLK